MQHFCPQPRGTSSEHLLNLSSHLEFPELDEPSNNPKADRQIRSKYSGSAKLNYVAQMVLREDWWFCIKTGTAWDSIMSLRQEGCFFYFIFVFFLLPPLPTTIYLLMCNKEWNIFEKTQKVHPASGTTTPKKTWHTYTASPDLGGCPAAVEEGLKLSAQYEENRWVAWTIRLV